MESEMVIKTARARSRRKAMASSSRLPMRREHESLEGIKTCGAHGTIDVYVEATQNREDVMSVQGSDRNKDAFTPKGYLGCVLHVRVFWSFGQRLYMCVKCF
jgi:hypothetical protein